MLGGKGVTYTKVGQSNAEMQYDKLRDASKAISAEVARVPGLALSARA